MARKRAFMRLGNACSLLKAKFGSSTVLLRQLGELASNFFGSSLRRDAEWDLTIPTHIRVCIVW